MKQPKAINNDNVEEKKKKKKKKKKNKNKKKETKQDQPADTTATTNSQPTQSASEANPKALVDNTKQKSIISLIFRRTFNIFLLMAEETEGKVLKPNEEAKEPFESKKPDFAENIQTSQKIEPIPL